MKLSDHVDQIRVLTHKSFSNYFARLGITAKKVIEIEKLPANLKSKREKVDRVIKSHLEETGSFGAAFEKTLDEYTFTLFNRIAAVKVMEAHRLFPDVITKRPENGNRSFSHRAWLENNQDMAGEELEGIRQFIKFEFNRLGEEIPLYHKDYPYALLPYVIELNEIIDAFNAVEKDADIEDTIWQSDDILGWLYESYNNAKKQEHKSGKNKTEYDKVYLQSQVYTPRWVVKFKVDNSLGKLYLEMYPDSHIKEKYKIANAPNKQTRTIKPLTEIRLVDLATGSGNYLFYAFDLFYDLYMDQIDNYGADYDEDEIPKLTIENNLYGIDIDNRAIQIAQLGLYIKAMRKKRDVHIEKFNIVSSDFILPAYEDVSHLFKNTLIDKETTDLLKDIWGDLQMAHKFGSLVRIEEKVDQKINHIKDIAKRTSYGLDGILKKWENWKQTFIPEIFKAVDESSVNNGDTFLKVNTKAALIYLSILTSKHDVAVCNPPYTDSADFGPELKKFIDANYKQPFKFNSNLYACFIKRCCELTDETGYVALIHPHTFMFIKSFEDVRKYIIEHTHIDLLVDYGLDRVNLFGPGILLEASLYVLSKKRKDEEGIYFNITANQQEKFKKVSLAQTFDDVVNKRKNERAHKLAQSKLKIIDGWPFIYWISDGFREKFKEKALKEICPPRSGLATSNNERFLRFWWEVDFYTLSNTIDDQLKWKIYSKGGPYNKWQGNLWAIVNWANNAQEMRLTGSAVFRNEGFYFKEGITYSASGSKGASFRHLPENCVYDVGGASLFLKDKSVPLMYILAILNSKLCFYIIDCLNPTVNTQVGDIERIPFVRPSKEFEKIIVTLASQNIKIKNHLNSYRIIETSFDKNPLTAFSEPALRDRILTYLNHENIQMALVLLNEAIINQLVFEIYNLSPEDRKQVEIKMGKPVGELPLLAEAKDAYLSTTVIENEAVKEFIQKLTTTTFEDQYVLSIRAEFTSLYQSNNDLEEFCISHQVNPI
ncbi:MAG: BREX-1 system adenine-specific DNA-methyltransferase PglX, partial [Desulfobacterales bacterium]|nr:BREX-1 system adenine-specific DNA-methyltransferase PglX [Desulfobacterales bacterium]